MMLRPLKESVLSSVSTQALIFATKTGSNHGLGKVFINITRGGSVPTGMSYPSAKSNSAMKVQMLVMETLRLLSVTTMAWTNSSEYFAPNHAKGFTDIGLARINQSIQAFCYSVLGAQANSHTSIIGDSGSVKNTQIDFLTLVEDAIKL